MPFFACIFYGIPIDEKDLLQLMKRYPRFQPSDGDRAEEDFDEDAWWDRLAEDLWEIEEDLYTEFEEEYQGVTLGSFNFGPGKNTFFLAIRGTVTYLDDLDYLRYVELGDSKDWNNCLKDTCAKCGIGWTEPKCYLLKSYPRVRVALGYGMPLSHDELVQVVTAHRALLSERYKGVFECDNYFFDALADLIDAVEEAWAAKPDPIRIVQIRRGNNGDLYYLMIRDIYQANECISFPRIDSTQRVLWDLLLKAKSVQYDLEWQPPGYLLFYH